MSAVTGLVAETLLRVKVYLLIPEEIYNEHIIQENICLEEEVFYPKSSHSS